MGRLTYDATTVIEFEDRLLAHLQVVIGGKIRHNQSFYFTWKNDPDMGNGRGTLWISPRMPLHFRYGTGRMPPLNREWLRILTVQANSPEGLKVLPEPGPDGKLPASVPTGRVSTDRRTL